jgi:citrate synthase
LKSLLNWRRSPFPTNICTDGIMFSISRKLYPNVDFYSGLIYRAMGFPTDMFPVLFTIPRVAGWIAHWVEFLADSENNIYRPRQNYIGHSKR